MELFSFVVFQVATTLSSCPADFQRDFAAELSGDAYKQCVEACVAENERPGYALKRCIEACRKQLPAGC